MASHHQQSSKNRSGYTRPGRVQSTVIQTAQRGIGTTPALLQRRLGNRATQAWLAEQAPMRQILMKEQANDMHGRKAIEEEELLQRKFDPIQCQEPEEENELLQGKFAANEAHVQFQSGVDNAGNRTGMPNPLKAGLEQLSGMDLSGVRVHHNSSEPAQLNALAYTQGQDIHMAPGQEKHLAHEGWHAVQQMQGRVKPTVQSKGVSINDGDELEREADVMGTKALQMKRTKQATTAPILQRATANEEESGEEDTDQFRERVARALAERLTEIARGQTVRETQTTGTSAREAEGSVQRAAQGETIQRLQDLPGRKASANFHSYLGGVEASQNFPILSAILYSPTLRPYDVEQAARSRTLTNFSRHPGSTFLGTVGEALVWRAIKYQSRAGIRGRMSTHVFPQPGTLISMGISVPPSVTPLLPLVGSLLPDLLVILIGLDKRINLGPFGTYRIQQSPQLLNVVSPTTRRVGSHTFSGRTVFGFYEVTTSTQWRHIQPRAVRVAAMARALGKARLPGGTQVISLLAMDRRTYFNLPAANRTTLVNTVTSAGGFIGLFRDLTKISLHNARALARALAAIPRTP